MKNQWLKLELSCGVSGGEGGSLSSAWGRKECSARDKRVSCVAEKEGRHGIGHMDER